MPQELSGEQLAIIKALAMQERDRIAQICAGSQIRLEYMRQYLDALEEIIQAVGGDRDR